MGLRRRLSYGELADRSLRAAGALVERGVRSGDTVAVSLPKGPDQLTAVLGVLAAGAAYVPIGVEQPAARRDRIRTTAGFRVALTDGRPVEGVDAVPLAEAVRSAPLTEPVAADEEQPAYVLFTSGSTGEPKGVEVPHRAAMNTIDDLNDRFGVGTSDRCLALSALDFDLSVYDTFGLLSAGGAVVLVDDGDRREASQWADLVRTHAVTVLNCVPSLLDMLLLATAPGELTGLCAVLLGGDWVGTDLPGRLAERAPGCRFTGLGGTTETAIHSTVCEVTVHQVPAHWRAVPYGTPLRNVRCRVVDVHGRDCPDWVPGELWIGGEGVALGYRADPSRTAEKFTEADGLRWYRTGDLARYWPDGTLEFLGRRDHQVKVRGFRIELGEVEAALAGHPAVRRAVAGLTRGQGVQLAAAVAAYADTAEEELREWARSVLPPHMVPARIAVAEELPLTSNGKLDRRAVQELWQVAETDTHRAPGTALETVVARVWQDVLGVERVGLDDGFFALGGDSVLATVIVGRLREALDTSEVTVRSLFATLTAGGWPSGSLPRRRRRGGWNRSPRSIWRSRTCRRRRSTPHCATHEKEGWVPFGHPPLLRSPSGCSVEFLEPGLQVAQRPRDTERGRAAQLADGRDVGHDVPVLLHRGHVLHQVTGLEGLLQVRRGERDDDQVGVELVELFEGQLTRGAAVDRLDVLHRRGRPIPTSLISLAAKSSSEAMVKILAGVFPIDRL
ncbi:amino acid adenylation domain-containing protein [Streptomyces sp. MS1.AVA.1]|uniref:Amino acid adenylation domain-containing protein n=1 Tax=Streptomyces machairae TaxID=3134109 RepID=A0ABU8UHM8_9ACTN